MALQPTIANPKAEVHHDLLRVIVIAALAVAVLLAFTMVVGMQATGPFYEIVPDPAGLSLPF